MLGEHVYCNPPSIQNREIIATETIRGIDHVRVPVDFEVLETPEGIYIEDGFKYIDNCLAWCEKYQLNMILDLHKTAGYSFDELSTSEVFF